MAPPFVSRLCFLRCAAPVPAVFDGACGDLEPAFGGPAAALFPDLTLVEGRCSVMVFGEELQLMGAVPKHPEKGGMLRLRPAPEDIPAKEAQGPVHVDRIEGLIDERRAEAQLSGAGRRRYWRRGTIPSGRSWWSGCWCTKTAD